MLRELSATDQVRMPVAAPTQPPDDLGSELHARLRGFAGRRVADPDAADDLAQEVVRRLHRSLGDLRAQDRLVVFAYRIARNAIIDYYRADRDGKASPRSPRRRGCRSPRRRPRGRARDRRPRASRPLSRAVGRAHAGAVPRGPLAHQSRPPDGSASRCPA